MGKLLIQESIWQSFISKLKTRIENLTVGTAFDHQADVGSPTNKVMVSNIADAVAQAKTRGLEVSIIHRNSN
jgi:NAD-dependent aldehyde dehydrogenases